MALLAFTEEKRKKKKEKKKQKSRKTDEDTDSDTDNDLFLTQDNWPKSLVVKSANEERPLSKLSPFATQKGFQAVTGTHKEH